MNYYYVKLYLLAATSHGSSLFFSFFFSFKRSWLNHGPAMNILSFQCWSNVRTRYIAFDRFVCFSFFLSFSFLSFFLSYFLSSFLSFRREHLTEAYNMLNLFNFPSSFLLFWFHPYIYLLIFSLFFSEANRSSIHLLSKLQDEKYIWNIIYLK